MRETFRVRTKCGFRRAKFDVNRGTAERRLDPVHLRIQQPGDPESALLEAILTACQGAESGGGIFAWASASGVQLLIEDEAFVDLATTGPFRLVIGVDAITDAKALDELSRAEKRFKGLEVRAFLHNEPNVLFHPKCCWFRRGAEVRLIVGSGNLTLGGLRGNWEAFAEDTLKGTTAVAFQEAIDIGSKQSKPGFSRWMTRTFLRVHAAMSGRAGSSEGASGVRLKLAPNFQPKLLSQALVASRRLSLPKFRRPVGGGIKRTSTWRITKPSSGHNWGPRYQCCCVMSNWMAPSPILRTVRASRSRARTTALNRRQPEA
jgi:HKD family nuclease